MAQLPLFQLVYSVCEHGSRSEEMLCPNLPRYGKSRGSYVPYTPINSNPQEEAWIAHKPESGRDNRENIEVWLDVDHGTSQLGTADQSHKGNSWQIFWVRKLWQSGICTLSTAYPTDLFVSVWVWHSWLHPYFVMADSFDTFLRREKYPKPATVMTLKSDNSSLSWLKTQDEVSGHWHEWLIEGKIIRRPVQPRSQEVHNLNIFFFGTLALKITSKTSAMK